MQPAVLGQRRAALLRLLVIALEHAGRAGQHLAVVGDPHLDAREDAPDGLGIDLAVGLRRAHAGQLGGAVDLLQVDPDRAEEAERVGAERRAAGIDEPGAAQPELIAQRRVDQRPRRSPAAAAARAAPADPRPRGSRRARRRARKCWNSERFSHPESAARTVTAVSVFSQ